MHNARCGMAVANSANPEDNPTHLESYCVFPCVFAKNVVSLWQKTNIINPKL